MIHKNIVSIGCSYGLNLDANILKQKHNLIHFNYSYPSIALEGILEVIKCLKNNYKNDLFVVGITNASRLTKKIPNNILEYPVFNASTLYNLCSGKYSTFIETEKHIKNVKEFPYEWWKSIMDIHRAKTIEEHLKEYLITLKEIQNELEGYDYLMYLMNNTFEGYYYDKDLLRHKYSDNAEYKIINLENTLDLESLFPEEWNNIDKTKIVFYKTNGIRYGGMDEYCIDNFESNCMNDYRPNTNPYGSHPNNNVHLNFFENYILPKIK